MRKSNLITFLYTTIAVSYGKENFKVFTKICLFCYLQHGEKREKSVVGHGSDKLIESYSEQPTTEQQFESYSIIRPFKSLTQINPVSQPVLTDGPYYFFYLSFPWLPKLPPSTAINPGFCQLLQIGQFLCFIVVDTFLTLAAAVSDMVGFSLLIH